MKILTIKTDTPDAEVTLFDDQKLVNEIKWHAHRDLAKTIHLKIQDVLHGRSAQKIEGIAVFKGPGSFTGLRIGITVANALADGLQIPIVGANGRGWDQHAIKQLLAGKDHKIILPDYGAPAKTTLPKIDKRRPKKLV